MYYETHVVEGFLSTGIGFDHGIGHPLLLLCHAKAPQHPRQVVVEDPIVMPRGQQSAVRLCDLPHIPKRRGRGYTQEQSQESKTSVIASDWWRDRREKKAYRGNDCRRLWWST